MNYRVYKFVFDGMVHFGNAHIEDSNYTFMADTLFSALCHEAIRDKDTSVERLVKLAKDGKILFSDAFPYIGNELFLPKPYLKIESDETTGDSVLKKLYKKMKYIPLSQFDEYLSGNLDVMNIECINSLGHSQMKVSAAVRGNAETLPYQIGMYSYNEGNGLYIIVGYEEEDDADFIEDLLTRLSFSGIGGKRFAGLGRFNLCKINTPAELVARLKQGKTNMALSLGLPQDSELDSVMDNAQYSLIKRSGFVQSDKYANEQVRKNDIYTFAAGACFEKVFDGDVYDVSDGYGSHPVYRYAKPIFMEVDVHEK